MHGPEWLRASEYDSQLTEQARLNVGVVVDLRVLVIEMVDWSATASRSYAMNCVFVLPIRLPCTRA